MGIWEPYLDGRALAMESNGNSNQSLDVTMAAESNSQFNSMYTNSTDQLVSSLVLGQLRTIRTMHITLGGFSLGLAVLTLLRILCDARRAAKLQVTLRPEKLKFLRAMHPAETFPLVLTLAIIAQQLILIAVQTTALDSMVVSGCSKTAQIVFPAIFLVGFSMFVFGTEAAFRAMSTESFTPRGKRITPSCLAVMAVMILLIWIPTTIWQMTDACFGDTIWYPFRYHLIAVIVLSIMILGFICCGCIIAFRLMTTANIDPVERVSASRMFYYLMSGVVLYVLVLPFFVNAQEWDFTATLTTYRIADVALYSDGIAFAFLHLFLRVNTGLTVIKTFGTQGGPWQKRRRVRLFGPSDLEMVISPPLNLAKQIDTSTDNLVLPPEKERWPQDDQADYARNWDLEKNPRQDKLQSIAKPPVDPTLWPLPPNPLASPPTRRPSTATESGHKRAKSSYSLFPTRAEDIPRLPATIYSPPRASKALSKRDTRASTSTRSMSISDASWLHLPAPLFSRNHRRDSSADTTATVQIGLRLSLAPAIAAAPNASMSRVITPPPPPPPPPNSRPPPPAQLTRETTDSSQETLGLPIQNFSSAEQSSHSPSTETASSKNIISDLPLASPKKSLTPAKITPQNSGQYLQKARDKVLPPTPRGSTASTQGTPPVPTIPKFSVRGPVSGLRMNPVTPPPSIRPPPPGLGSGTMQRGKDVTSPKKGDDPSPAWI